MEDPRRPAVLDGKIVVLSATASNWWSAPPPSRDRTESVVIVKEALLADLKPQVRALEADLLARSEQETTFRASLHEEWEQARKTERTAATDETWLDGEVTQAAVAWVLGTVFLRFCEDNGLVDVPYLAAENDSRWPPKGSRSSSSTTQT